MIRAVLFDVDGTLYHQPPLRALMAAELAGTSWLATPPWRVPRLLRSLSAFRQAREELRDLGRPVEPLATLQFTRPAEQAGVAVADMVAAVEEWIYRRPLKYLPRVARKGLGETLAALGANGVRIGVFSDYPVADKLAAMGVRSLVDLELDATSEDINAFKPHPRGLEVACARWGLAADEVLYVGDRADVDAEAARRAGMPCAILGGGRGPTGTSADWFRVDHVGQLLERVTMPDGNR